MKKLINFGVELSSSLYFTLARKNEKTDMKKLLFFSIFRFLPFLEKKQKFSFYRILVEDFFFILLEKAPMSVVFLPLQVLLVTLDFAVREAIADGAALFLFSLAPPLAAALLLLLV